jgi:hypothetical protein
MDKAGVERPGGASLTKAWRWWDRTIRLGVLVGTHKQHLVMKKLSKKGVLLFAGVIAVCAFAMPSMASAAS